MAENQAGEINNSDIEEGELPLEIHELPQTEKNKKTTEDSKQKLRKAKKTKIKKNPNASSEEEDSSRPRKQLHKDDKNPDNNNNEKVTNPAVEKNSINESDHSDKPDDDTTESESSKYASESEESDQLSKKSSSFEIEYFQSHQSKSKSYPSHSSSQSSRRKSSSRSDSIDSYSSKNSYKRRRTSRSRKEQKGNNDKRAARRGGSYSRENKVNKKNYANNEKSPVKRTDSESNKYEQDSKKMLYKVCKNYVRKTCKNGDRCPFSHNMKDYPCKYNNALGKCDRGAQCRYSHDPFPSAEHRREFIQDNMDFLLDLKKKRGSLEIDQYLLPLIPPQLQQKPSFHPTPIIMNQPLPPHKHPPPPQNAFGFFPGPPNLPPGNVPPRQVPSPSNGIIMGAPPYPNIMGVPPINPPITGHGMPPGPVPIMKPPHMMISPSGQPPLLPGANPGGNSNGMMYMNPQNQVMGYLNQQVPSSHVGGQMSSMNPNYYPGAPNMTAPPPQIHPSQNPQAFHAGAIPNVAPYQSFGGALNYPNVVAPLGSFNNAPPGNIMNLPPNQPANPLVNNYNIPYSGTMMGMNTQPGAMEYQRQQEGFPGMMGHMPQFKPSNFQGNPYDPLYNEPRNIYQNNYNQGFQGQNYQNPLPPQLPNSNLGYNQMQGWPNNQISMGEPNGLLVAQNLSNQNNISSTMNMLNSNSANSANTGIQGATSSVNNTINSNMVNMGLQRNSEGPEKYTTYNNERGDNLFENNLNVYNGQIGKGKKEMEGGDKIELGELNDEKSYKKDEISLDEKKQKQLAMRNTLKSLNVLKNDKTAENSADRDSSSEKKGLLKELEEKLYGQLPPRQDLKILVNKFFKSKDPRKQQQHEKLQKQFLKEKEDEKS